MDRKAIATGATVDEAIDAACAKLGVMREDVEIDVLERAGSKFFGLKKIPAKVEVTLNDEYAAKLEAEEKKAEPAEIKKETTPDVHIKFENKSSDTKTSDGKVSGVKTKEKPKKEPKKESVSMYDSL